MSAGRFQSVRRLEKEILDVIECEQRRLGQNLHDGLCQELAGIALLANSMQRKIADGGGISDDQVAELAAVVREALRHARGLARGLDPVAAAPEGLSIALQQLAVDTADAAHVECKLHQGHAVEVAEPPIAIHLYRIAQEAVGDAVREGRATKISIELVQNPDGIEITIRDDGVNRIRRPCALQMMKHRARVIGACLNVEAGAAEPPGTRVVCTLPLGKPMNRRLP